jgi:hypothetical protein
VGRKGENSGVERSERGHRSRARSGVRTSLLAPIALVAALVALGVSPGPLNAGPSKAPSISNFSPTGGGVGTTVTINGRWFQNTSAVKFAGTTASFRFVSGSQITATVPSGAASGPISVTTPGGTATSSGSFTVVAMPSISDFTPTSGGVGSVVTINGSNLSGATDVSFAGTSASRFTVVSGSQITATVPSGAASGTISVTTPGGTATSSGTFTVVPAPSISGFSPTSGPAGASVTINGSNLSGATAVKFAGTNASSFTVDSAIQITATVPSVAATGTISVTTPGGTGTSSDTFTVVSSSPSVVAHDTYQRTVSNGWGSADVGGSWSLLDTPANWSVSPGTGTIRVAAGAQERGVLPGVTVQDVDLLAQISLPLCTMGAGADCDSYVVGRLTGVSNPSYYRVGAVEGTGQSTVNIRAQRSDGSYLTNDVNTGVSAADGIRLWLRVEFVGVNPTMILARVWPVGTTEPSAWQLTTTDNTAAEQTAGGVGVRVRNEDGGSAHTFTFSSYQATALTSASPPTVTGFAPTSGSVGASVTISGSNLSSAAAVRFGGATAAYTVNSDSQIMATVPANAATGPISVSSPGGTTTTSTSFTVTVPPPRIISVGPFQVQWSLTDPEEITSFSWNGSSNLTGNWGGGTQCTGGYAGGDQEFFGNAWGIGGSGVHAVLVGLGSAGTWSTQSGDSSTTVSIASSASAPAYCSQDAGVPVSTTYQFPNSGNVFSMQRTFAFGTTAFSGDLRPYIPRFSPEAQFTSVYYPTMGGTLAQVNEGLCDTGCEETNWNGSWFVLANSSTGLDVVVRRTAPAAPVALWVDQDGGSNTSATGVLLLQPVGGFTGTVTESESFCFANGWTPNLTLPSGC